MLGNFVSKIKDKAIQIALQAQLKKLPKDQMSAMLEVGKKYQSELQEAMKDIVNTKNK